MMKLHFSVEFVLHDYFWGHIVLEMVSLAPGTPPAIGEVPRDIVEIVEIVS